MQRMPRGVTYVFYPHSLSTSSMEYLARREQFLIKYHAHRPQGFHHESCLKHRPWIELSLCGHSRQSLPSVILFSGIKAALSQSGLGDILLLAYLGCVSVCAHMLCTPGTGERITCRNRFSSCSMWVLQIELRSQVLTHQVTLLFLSDNSGHLWSNLLCVKSPASLILNFLHHILLSSD